MAEVAKKPRRKAIPATIKRLVWNKYIGESVGKTKCTCCGLTDITQLSFHCGHVIADAQGGKVEIDNLRPICQNCNSSMSATNMDTFKAALQASKQPVLDVQKIKEFESEYQKCIRVIHALKAESNKVRRNEEFEEMKNFHGTPEFYNQLFRVTPKKKYISKYDQINIDILSLENIITPMNQLIMSSKTDIEFTIEKQKLIKLADELKIRWKITEPFNW